MGKRTSVYLSDAQDAAMKAAGLTLAEVVRRGLASAGSHRLAPVAAEAEAVDVREAGAQKPGLHP